MTVMAAYRVSDPEAPVAPARVVLIGGSGQVGRILARHFYTRGSDVCVVARTTYSAPWRVAAWDANHMGPWTKQLEAADVVINLAGRSVNCRYHRWNRREILDSRVRSTELLGQAIGSLRNPPRLWLNASTATIYRHSLSREMDEAGELGGTEPEKDVPDEWRFSIDVAKRWEETFFWSGHSATRKVALRSAMIMSPDGGGVFDTLSRLVRLRLGGKAGSGRQYVSWIHEQDFARAVDFVIANGTITGALNLASPNPIPNSEFMRKLRQAWGIAHGLSATERMLEVGAFFLRTETELILKSRRVVPGRLLNHGFRFDFPNWAEASKDLVSRWRLTNRKRQKR
jgi:uncharacterized protein (TIGR01777 family)